MSNPSGLCLCGCGKTTNIAKDTRSAIGWIKGQPVYYLNGHQRRVNLFQRYTTDSNGCWIWTGQYNLNGYGQMGVKFAHVAMYEKVIGTVPAGHELDHTCRNIKCVNPSHLEPVTHAENVRRGSCAKLKRETVLEIRNRPHTGYGHVVKLAKEFGIPRTTVSGIVNNQRWVGLE